MIPLPLAKDRTCGDCRECCIVFPFSPIADFWPVGKPAGALCSFAGPAGCSIHDQPRPAICTDFWCNYLSGEVPQRPSECGVLFIHPRLNNLFRGDLPPGFAADEIGIQIIETRPEAIFQLQAQKVRYWHRKVNWRVAAICLFGFDMQPSPLKCRMIDSCKLAVFWKDEPTYADRAVEWWVRN